MKLNILIVDDELEICKVLQRFLEIGDDYNVKFETNPVAALEKIKRGGFHMVISDIMMPGMDGVELLKEIRKANGLIQVIMITAYSTVEKVIACLEAGAADYIMKPFEDINEIKEIVDNTASKLTRWRRVVVNSQQLTAKTSSRETT